MLFTLLKDPPPIPKALSYDPAYSHPRPPPFPKGGGAGRAVEVGGGAAFVCRGVLLAAVPTGPAWAAGPAAFAQLWPGPSSCVDLTPGPRQPGASAAHVMHSHRDAWPRQPPLPSTPFPAPPPVPRPRRPISAASRFRGKRWQFWGYPPEGARWERGDISIIPSRV